MAATPKKLVHWDLDSPSISPLNSPFFNNTYESSVVSTSSLEFINSQLVAHGFVPSPGLSLEGISNDDSTRVVKCLLGMLGQRVEDMSRTEDLTAKFRTLSYDHERMLSMCRIANEKAANAERETNVHKSRLTAALKNLQVSDTAHKQTSAELQRTRTTLQGVRAAHTADVKKKEKDTERVIEKWQKLVDSQVKLSAPSGLRCRNVAPAEGSEILGRGYLEIALEEAEQAQISLGNKNLHLRDLLLNAVNELQSILHQAQNLLPDSENLEAPTPLTPTTLFPISPPTATSDKLNSVLAGLRQTLTTLSQPTNKTCTSKPVPLIPDGELERLRGIITTLKEEISHSQKKSIVHAAETQAMFDKFAKDHRVTTGEIGEMSVELMSAPLRDEEKERLDSLRRELDTERQRFTEAAVKFGREKAALEAERLKFLDEKRSWQVEMMLADFPPTPLAPASPTRPAANLYNLSPKKSTYKSPQKSPHKSPAKGTTVGKAGSPKSRRSPYRVSRRSPSKATFSYETELIPPIAAPSFPTVKSLTSSLLPTSFVLPPPSPRASLPTEPALPPAVSNLTPQNATSQTQSSTSSSTSESALSSPEINVVPSTPPAAIRRPFPVAKPFVPRMIHAYSPARPSPLSRILMLSDSPLSPPCNSATSGGSLSPTSGPLAVVLEEAASDDGGLGSEKEVVQPLSEPKMSLAAELGVESPPDTPLHEKMVGPNNNYNPKNGLGQARVFHPDPNVKKPPKNQGKGKVKEDPRPRSSAEAEKENNSRPNPKVLAGKSGKISPAMSGGNTAAVTRKILPTNEPRKPVAKSAAKLTSTTASAATSRAKTFTKPSVPPSNSGGPRRVLITSADAPPIGKARKG